MARATRATGNKEMSETGASPLQTPEPEEQKGALPDLESVSEPDIVSFVENTLDRLSVDSLVRIGYAVRAKRQAKQEESRVTARQKIETELKATGLSLRDLFPEFLPSTTRKRNDDGALPPKFRGPNGETWTGRGRLPNWLAILEKGGHSQEEFRIKEDGA